MNRIRPIHKASAISLFPYISPYAVCLCMFSLNTFLFFIAFQLCTALETANKLVHSTNSNVGMLKDKVEELWEVINRRDATIEAAKAFEGSPKQPESSQ